MLSDTQVHAFQRDGFVHGGSLLTDPEVTQLQAELDRIIRLHDRSHTDQVFIGDTAAFCQQRDCFLQITNLRELSEQFSEVTTRSRLVSAAVQLLGRASLRVFADAMLYKNNHNKAVNEWHQDGPAFDILSEPNVLTAWIALDDVGEGDGCVCFARGSHRWIDSPAAVIERLKDSPVNEAPEFHHCLMRRGDVHFHHGLTWHCSLENQNGRPRRGFVVNYIPTDVRFAASGAHYLKRFVESSDGEPLAGRHFPPVSISLI